MAKQSLCKIDGCGKPSMARNWCTMHYKRWRRNGDPLARRCLANGEALEEVRRLFIEETDECVIWPHSKDRHGYGQVSMNEGGKYRPIGVHVVVCEMRHGPRPSASHQAAHSCGNGHLACCNKHHIRWATRSENEKDKTAHGTRFIPPGFLRSNATLSEQQVLEIRASYGDLTQAQMARKFGVSQSAISAIITRKTWPNIG